MFIKLKDKIINKNNILFASYSCVNDSLFVIEINFVGNDNICNINCESEKEAKDLLWSIIEQTNRLRKEKNKTDVSRPNFDLLMK